MNVKDFLCTIKMFPYFPFFKYGYFTTQPLKIQAIIENILDFLHFCAILSLVIKKIVQSEQNFSSLYFNRIEIRVTAIPLALDDGLR